MQAISYRLIFAVIVASVIGTLANALGAAMFLGSEKLALALVPGRYLVAIGCVAVLPFVERWVSGMKAHAVGLILLVLLPSLLAKLVFGATAPWLTVLLLNSVFAVAAWLTYRLIRRADVPPKALSSR